MRIAEKLISEGKSDYNQSLNHPDIEYQSTPIFDVGYMRRFRDGSFIAFDKEGGNGVAYVDE
jgi:hypothetical protein